VLERWLSDRRIAVAAVLVSALLWGSAFPAIKRGYQVLGIDPDAAVGGVLAFAGIRFIVAGAILLGGAAALRLGAVVRSPRRLAGLAALGLVQTTLQYSAFYVGLVYTSGVKASVIVASGSFFLAAFSPLFYPTDRLGAWRVLGLLVGFAGVVIANVDRGGPRDLEVQWVGDALVLLTGLCSAVGSLLGKRLVQDTHPAVVTGYQLSFGAIAMLAVAIPAGGLSALQPSVEIAGLTLYLAVVSAVAFTLYYLVVKLHDLSRVAAYRFSIPVAGVALSAWLIPGETLGWPLCVAALLVAFGVWIVNRAPSRGPAISGRNAGT
jgi:drug/metabolite transporter (DMT)-like permease